MSRRHTGDAGHDEVGGTLDPAEASQCVGDDGGLQHRLGIVGDVLPVAAAAPVGNVGARGRHPLGRRAEHLADHGPGEVLAAFGHVDPHPLAGEGAADEEETTVVIAGQRRPAGDDAAARDLHRPHVTGRALALCS